MQQQVPLIYFLGIVPGRYLASWPAYIVGDDPRALAFTVAVDDKRLMLTTAPQTAPVQPAEVEIRRRYITRLVRQRLHQQAFCERVLRAYREHCAICRLRHQELLEAAHIVDDADPEGEPRVSNGLALCKLHPRRLRRAHRRGATRLRRRSARRRARRGRRADAQTRAPGR